MRNSILLGPVFVMLLFAEVRAETFQCEIAKKTWCAKSGCNSGAGKGEYVVINTDNQTYSLCVHGKSKCQILKLKGARAFGAFVSFKFGGNGYLKMTLIDSPAPVKLNKGEFMEIRDNLLGAMTSYGNCKTLR